MENNSYAIYLKNRPIKIAYIIDEAELALSRDLIDDFFDELINKSYQNWGGRTNPIITFKDNNFSKENWNYLKVADADYIISFGNLNEAFVREIDAELQPYHLRIEELDKPNQWVRDGIRMYPTKANLKEFEEATFIVFDFAENCDSLVRSFVLRNFGSYDQWINPRDKSVCRNVFEQKFLSKVPVEKILLSDRESLANALVKLSGTHHGAREYKVGMNFVLPSMLPSIDIPDNNRLTFGNYQLVVGNHYEDILEFWNRAFFERQFLRPHLRQLWLPEELALDPDFSEAVYFWLHRYTGAGNSNAQSVDIISKSLSRNVLEEIRINICENESRPLPSTILTEEELEEERRDSLQEYNSNPYARLLPPPNSAIRFTGNSSDETLLVPKPSILDKILSPDGAWIVDVQMELKIAESHFGRDQSWWQIPRATGGGLLFTLFNRSPARINKDRLFSLRVENRLASDYRAAVKPEIKISIPIPSSVPGMLVCQPNYHPHLNADLRYKFPFKRSQISLSKTSDKGEYLRGLIKVFGGFSNSLEYCQRRYWREAFAKLARQDLRRDLRLQEVISNTISKYKGRSNSSEHIAEKVLGKINDRRGDGMFLPLSQFQDILAKVRSVPITTAMQYSQGDTEIIVPHYQHVGELEMKRGLERLVQSNFLRRGANITCTFCGITSSYSIDELRHAMLCPGCGHQELLGANEVGFGLSTLAEMGIIQGQLPTLHAYACLALQCRTSFLFSPSLELFEIGQTSPWHEVDVFAICDGNFVIGSVKGGRKAVIEDDFMELVEVAERIRPQKAIMFLPLETSDTKAEELFKTFNEKLSRNKIIGELFQLPVY